MNAVATRLAAALWRRNRAAPPVQGRVTVAELVRFGLDRCPTAIGVYWPEDQAVVCREHVTGRQHRGLMLQLRSPGDEARLLVGSPDAAQMLRRECVHCKGDAA